MVLPSMAALSVFVLFPIVDSFYLSLFHWDLLSNERSFAGFANYAAAFGDPRFWNALVRTFYYTVMYVPGLMLVSMLLAFGLDRRFAGNHLLRGIYFLPSITSMAIVALVWRFLIDHDVGLLSAWIRSLGLPVVDFLHDPAAALPTVVWVSVWRWAGFNMVILLAGLNTIPESLYEAATIDGAGEARKIFSISLPLLLPSLSFVLVTNVIASFQVFDPVYVMTKGGPLFSTEVMVYYVYYQGFTLFRMGYASALAYLLFVVILVFTLVQLRQFTRQESNTRLA